jgi:hypothetical protein
MSNTMSKRLSDTLGMLESRGIDIIEAPQYGNESETVSSQGGAVIPFVPKNVPSTLLEADVSDIRDDYITSRNLTHTLIDMAGKALEGSLSVAVETQHPKAFTVFNELANTMRLLSKDLLEMQKIYKEITADKAAKLEAAEKAQNITQNNINVTTHNLSLSDALKMIKAESEKADIEDAENVKDV